MAQSLLQQINFSLLNKIRKNVYNDIERFSAKCQADYLNNKDNTNPITFNYKYPQNYDNFTMLIYQISLILKILLRILKHLKI
jgi:hypothetical protein